MVAVKPELLALLAKEQAAVPEQTDRSLTPDEAEAFIERIAIATIDDLPSETAAVQLAWDEIQERRASGQPNCDPSARSDPSPGVAVAPEEWIKDGRRWYRRGYLGLETPWD